MTEIEIAGEVYRISKLPAMRQYHIVRRIGMLLTGLAAPQPAADNVVGFGGQEGDEASFDAVMRYVSPLLQAAGHMSDADSEYVIYNCLRVVERRQPGPLWSRVVVGSEDHPQVMFQDIADDLALMLQLVWAVLKENLANFFAIAGQMATGAARSPAA